jgi:hypothetical protein
VLSAKSPEAASSRALITVLQPRTAGGAVDVIEVRQTSDEIVVSVGRDRVRWRKTADGWQLVPSV